MRVVMMVMVAVVSGCGAQQAAVVGQVAAESQLMPVSLPFRSVLDPHWDADVFEAISPDELVLRSQAAIDAFLASHPRMRGYDADHKVYWETPMPVPDGMQKIDFGRDEAIVYVGGRGTGASTARIVGVEDVGDILKVHTVRWEDPSPPGPNDRVQGFVHVVLIPATDKPVQFLPTRQLTLEAGARPLWQAVGEPDLTTWKEYTRNELQRSSEQPPDLAIHDQAWLAANHPALVGDYGQYLPTSKVVVATSTGPVQVSQFLDEGRYETFPHATIVFSIEDGHPLAAVGYRDTGPAVVANPIFWRPLRVVPKHKAWRNPAIDRAYVLRLIEQQFGARPEQSEIEATTMQWAKDKLGYESPTYTLDSPLWGVTVNGAVSMGGSVSATGAVPSGNFGLIAIDVEDGVPIAVRLGTH
ncbi:MAG: hypothetical protein JWM80_3293 [Cyanobacteria bacterium RYN_339]|nr:hypothetical protein [Cyanobacteria bacterium RYN_339]